jgi:Anaphase-promoting complex subunit 4 WD40 domain
VQILKSPGDLVKAVAFSPDAQLLSSSGDQMVMLWNTATAEQVQVVNSDRVRVMAFSRDGHLLATASDDRSVKLWNAAVGEQLHEIKLNTVVSNMYFSSDNQCLESDRGVLRLPFILPSVPSPEPGMPDEIFYNDDWITRNNQRLLWLPYEFRRCSALKGGLLAMGQRSEQVNFIKFCFR